MSTNVEANSRVEVIDRNLARASQSLTLTDIVAAPNGDRLRIRIKSDSYDFQSYARIDRWDGTQWHNVHSIDYANMSTATKLSYDPRSDVTDFAKDRMRLLTAAINILG
jgi:hypothetical protein